MFRFLGAILDKVIMFVIYLTMALFLLAIVLAAWPYVLAIVFIYIIWMWITKDKE